MPFQFELDTHLEFSLELRAEEDADVIVDYVIHFQGSAGKLSGRKVYKLRRLRLAKGQRFGLTKRHAVRSSWATRTIYPGRHELEIRVNGNSRSRNPFWVSC